MGKLLVLDGFSLAFRAFFALPETMVTASGQYTNAVHGFTSMLLNLVKDHQPTHVAVAFDHPDPTFRDQIDANYKGTRSKTPDSLLSQIPFIAQVVRSFDIPLIEAPGFEADDVIATIARMAKSDGISTIIVTGDRDSFQLVSDPFVRVLFNRRGVSDYELLDEEGVEKRMGVLPSLYSQFAALRGDPSDNIPGVPGVGQKIAARLINSYGSIPTLLEHLDELTPKLASSIRESQSQLKINLDLIPLVDSIPLDVSIDDMKLGVWDPSRTEELFHFLEFNRIWNRALSTFDFRLNHSDKQDSIGNMISEDEDQAGALIVSSDITVVDDLSEIQIFGESADQTHPVFLLVEWSSIPGRSTPSGIAIAASVIGKDKVLQFSEDLFTNKFRILDIFAEIASCFSALSGFQLKEVLRFIFENSGKGFAIATDIAIADYLIDANSANSDLDSLASKWFGNPKGSQSNSSGRQMTMDIGAERDPISLGRMASLGLNVVRVLSKELANRELLGLYNEIEKPLVTVLARMEAVGIKVDRDYLQELQLEFANEAKDLQAEIQLAAGETFNVNSTQQLGRVLYEKLGLIPQKKTKTGYSTDARSLERLIDHHPIISKILRYREVEKLRSTYGESLIGEIGQDGRIHASFSQTVARTGRLSSDHPNLHNIPIRTTDGRRFRNAFVAPVDKKLIIADYSQIELRVIAHLSRDQGLIDAFEKKIDIHAQTASYTFGVPLVEVTQAQRSKAKMVAYGLAYGMEAYGLSQRLGISVSEADEILKSFFAGFPQLSIYMQETVDKAKVDGFTTTEFGRIRNLPELHSSNFRVREAAERQAMNAGIQGLAADIFKIALIELDSQLDSSFAQIVLQVHDEVLVECVDSMIDEVKAVVKETLESAVSLTVPLEVNVYVGDNWASAKE